MQSVIPSRNNIITEGPTFARVPRADPTNLDYVRSRLLPVFHDRAVVPYYALIYRLCEVGPWRFDPRALHHAIHGIAAAADLIREARPLLFTTIALRGQQLRWPMHRATTTIRALTDPARHALLDALAHSVRSTLDATTHAIEVPTPSPTRVTDDIEIARPSRAYHIELQHDHHLLAWITNDLPWIYPDDPRLWHVIREAADRQARLLIIARKVSPSTFALAKALGFLAVQYYAWLVPPDPKDLTASARIIGWPALLGTDAIPQHAMLKHLHTLTTPRDAQTAPTAAALTAIRDTVARHFDQNTGPTPAALRAWATDTKLELPPAWFDNLAAWAPPAPA